MKKFLAQPGFLINTATAGADISYLLAVVFTILFIVAWRLAKKGEGTKHHNLIFVSMVCMALYFVIYYLFRGLGLLAFEGKEGFGGSAETYNNVFMPILTTHLTLVTLGLIMSFYMVIQGFRACAKENGTYKLREGELKVQPKTFRNVMLSIFGLWAANQMILSFVRHASSMVSVAWALIFGTIALVVGLEKLIEKLLPDGARRHKIMGRGTMIIFSLILITSTLTYLMLYVIYPAKRLVIIG